MVFEKIYQWGNEKYGNVPRQTQELKDTTPTKGDLEQIKKLEYKLDDLIKHEEEWWVQRAKANWLAHGDKYLKYFHFKASQRKRKNKFVLTRVTLRGASNNLVGLFKKVRVEKLAMATTLVFGMTIVITTQPDIRWNNILIDQVFLPFESNIIKQIPLLQEPNDDQLVWPYTKEGVYTGYNVLKHWQDSTTTSTATNSYNPIWKRIWTLPTIPRHKAHLWRIYQQALPVRSVLNKRGIQCIILSPRCLRKEETINHVFMECHKAEKM
uniref:Retrotransposon-related protein n=1 Tax=Trifolium pratense TaxID=57577 RepID=A0A2K3MSY3_TRIPR|nr:retrotransposon-related protein [Trifolium pratense]